MIVDCAPTGETLRLLSFPDVARWWLEKVFPQQGRIMDAARPFARAVLDVALPGEEVLDDVQRLVRNLIAMNEILRDHERVSVRLVMNPDRMVIDEARRTFTYLNLYGYLTDAVVVNRVFPAEVGDYFGAWRERQQEQLREVEAAFAPVPCCARRTSTRRSSARRCSTASATPLFADARRRRRAARRASPRSSSSAPTRPSCAWRCRSRERGDVSLKKIGLELIVARRRPEADADAPAGAGRLPSHRRELEDGALHVTFDARRPSH